LVHRCARAHPRRRDSPRHASASRIRQHRGGVQDIGRPRNPISIQGCERPGLNRSQLGRDPLEGQLVCCLREPMAQSFAVEEPSDESLHDPLVHVISSLSM
jgi:hypothetical protein